LNLPSCFLLFFPNLRNKILTTLRSLIGIITKHGSLTSFFLSFLRHRNWDRHFYMSSKPHPITHVSCASALSSAHESAAVGISPKAVPPGVCAATAPFLITCRVAPRWINAGSNTLELEVLIQRIKLVCGFLGSHELILKNRQRMKIGGDHDRRLGRIVRRQIEGA
jgi:hypothetical protein